MTRSWILRTAALASALVTTAFLWMGSTPAGAGNTQASSNGKQAHELKGEFLPQPFDSIINVLGATKYADAYAGETTTRSGHLIIYIVRAKAMSFVDALHGAAAARHAETSSYSLVPVQHSWAQLNNLTSRIFADFPRLTASGIKLAQWGPDPVSNRVSITLQAYSSSIERELVSMYGSDWISVNHATESWAFTLTRNTDIAPFYAGDIEWFAGQTAREACTSNFSYRNNKTGAVYSFASGHCLKDSGDHLGAKVYTNTKSRKTLGTVAAQYYPRTHMDFSSVRGNFAGVVYGNGTKTYDVISIAMPPRGYKVTADGRVSGQVNGVTVESINQDITVSGVPLINMTVASKSGATVCQPGDSGGPWFIQYGKSQAYAIGLQVGERINEDGVRDPSVCVYEQIGNMLSVANGSIQT
jgi:hypothetical protein